MKQAIGYLIIYSFFVGLFVMCVRDIGIWGALSVFGIAFSILGILAFALYLILS